MTLKNGVKPPDDFRPIAPVRHSFGGLSTRDVIGEAQRHDAIAVDTKSRLGKHARLERWRPEFVEQIYHLALLGASTQQMCAALGVSHNTLSRWVAEKYSVQDALRKARLASSQVAASLFQRAVGYEAPATKFFQLNETRYEQDPETGKQVKVVEQKIHREDYTEHMPPDVRAAEIWLRNKEPETWGARDLVGAAGAGDTTVNNTLIFNTTNPEEASREYLRIMGGGPLALPPPKADS